MHLKQFKYYILPIIFCIYNNPLLPPSIAVTLCNRSTPQSNHQTIPPSKQIRVKSIITAVTSSQTKHISIVHHHQGSNSPSIRHKGDPNEPQPCIRSLSLSLLLRQLDSAYHTTHPYRTGGKAKKPTITKSKTQVIFYFPPISKRKGRKQSKIW